MAALPTLIASVAGLGPLDPATSHGFIIENPRGDQNGVNPPVKMRVYEGLPHFEGLPKILIMDLMINYDQL